LEISKLLKGKPPNIGSWEHSEKARSILAEDAVTNDGNLPG